MTMTRWANVSIGLQVRGCGFELPTLVEADVGEADPAPCLPLQGGEANTILCDPFSMTMV